MSETDVTLESPGGEAAAAAVTATPAGKLAAAEVADTPASIAAKDATLREQLAATEGLIGSPAALDWGHLNSAAAVKPDYKPTGPELPDQLDVNPDTIKEPVLSKQGWVLPTNDPRARFGGR